MNTKQQHFIGYCPEHGPQYDDLPCVKGQVRFCSQTFYTSGRRAIGRICRRKLSKHPNQRRY